MRVLTALLLASALASPALAQSTTDRDTPEEIENMLDGDSNIAGTDEAIEKSKIPMEGAVADTMGEAIALDKATDTYEVGKRPVVVLKDGYEKLEFEDATLADFQDAPVFGLDDTPIGSIRDMNRAEDGGIEGVVVIDGEERNVRVPETMMSGVRDDTGAARVYIDSRSLSDLPDA